MDLCGETAIIERNEMGQRPGLDAVDVYSEHARRYLQHKSCEHGDHAVSTERIVAGSRRRRARSPQIGEKWLEGSVGSWRSVRSLRPRRPIAAETRPARERRGRCRSATASVRIRQCTTHQPRAERSPSGRSASVDPRPSPGGPPKCADGTSHFGRCTKELQDAPEFTVALSMAHLPHPSSAAVKKAQPMHRRAGSAAAST